MFNFSRRSLRNLEGVHPDLVSVAHAAIKTTTTDFVVIEGLRTVARQRQLYTTGKSMTMNSRHITGHAIDVVPWVNGTVSWNWSDYYPIADAFKEAADELNVQIEWGGQWATFPDAPHFQLSRQHYPA